MFRFSVGRVYVSRGRALLHSGFSNIGGQGAFAGVWFRRALRLDDHAALSAATESGAPVVPFYILDPDLERKVRA